MSTDAPPAPSPLISPEALVARLDDPELRPVDVRWYLARPGAGRAAYAAGHVPGAIHLDLDSDLAAPSGPGRHPLPDPRWFAERLGAAGIGNDHLVVAYDDAGAGVAARLWWMLDALGHRRAVVLDGGLAAWIGAGLSITAEVPTHPAARLSLAAAWPRTIERDALRSLLGSVVILDARAPARYSGETEPIDPIAGHIPTAVSAPLDGNLGPDGRFLAPAALAERFRAHGAGHAGRLVVVSCGSGTNACANALAMRAGGLPDPLLYPGSYSDWSRSGFPVATGDEPGAVPERPLGDVVHGPGGGAPTRGPNRP